MAVNKIEGKIHDKCGTSLRYKVSGNCVHCFNLNRVNARKKKPHTRSISFEEIERRWGKLLKSYKMGDKYDF